MRDIQYLFIHCTATPVGKDYTTEQIRSWFVGKGWKMPGYHLVVHLDGRLERLCDDSCIANGVRGYNKVSIHIAYIGGLDTLGNFRDTRTRSQKKALITALRNIKFKYPNIIIKGHNEVANKMCPCFNVQNEYVSL